MKKKRIKLTFFIPDLSGGGAERVLVRLINGFDTNVFHLELVVFKKRGVLFDELRQDIKIVDLDCHWLCSFLKIVRYIFKRKPDICFSTLPSMNFSLSISSIPFLLNKRITFIARETTIPSLRLKVNKEYHKKRFDLNSLGFLFYKFFNVIVCQSDDMANDFAEVYKIEEKKIIKIHNPMPMLKDSGTASNGYFMSDKTNIVALGRLDYQKGFDLLINALAQTQDQSQVLHLFGEGPEESNLRILAETLNVGDRVLFHGFARDISTIFKTADVFVMSSRFEGFPNVLLEAMYFGCLPVVFSCKGGINEIIEHEENGILVPAENVSELAMVLDQKTYQLLDRDRIKSSIVERFHVDKILDQYASLFLRCVAQARSNK